MSFAKKFAWSGVAVLLAAVMGLGLLTSPVRADAPSAVNVIIVDADDTIDTPTTDIALIVVWALVTDNSAATSSSAETIVTFTTSAGSFLGSGTATQQVHCAQDTIVAAAAAIDAGDATDALTFAPSFGGATQIYSAEAESGNGDLVADAAEEGCISVSATLIVPKDQPIGQIVVSAKSTNNISGSEILTVNAASGSGDAAAMVIVSGQPTYNAIGYSSSTAQFNPVGNGTRFGIQLTDKDGRRLNGKTIMFTTDNGVFRDDDPTDTGTGDIEDNCDSTTDLGVNAFATTAGATDTTAGRAYVILCGTSGSVGKTANVKAVVVGQEAITVSKAITIAAKPGAADIKVTVTGSTITAEVMVGGVPAPDNTNIRFAIVPNTEGAVSAACVSLDDGKASTAFSVTPGKPVTVLVTAAEPLDPGSTNDAVSDTAALCGATDARVYGSSSTVLSGTTGGTTTPPAAGGSGTFAAAPVFSAAKLANVVFMGGTVVQLDAAIVAAGGTGAWAQDSKGVFILYVVNGGFVNDGFKAAFSAGLANPSALTVVGK